MLKPTILLDKSYLQGSKAIDIQQLAKSYQLLMADVLFYELISSAEPGRSRCFAKLRGTEIPVVLVKNFGALLKQEIHSHRACGKPSTQYEDTRFRFEEELASADYQIPPEAAETMEEEAEQLRGDVASLLARVRQIPTLIPNLLEGNDDERQVLREEAEIFIATEIDAILSFYRNSIASVLPPPGERHLPLADLLTQDWALFRWLQIQLLFALDAYCRYGGQVPQAPTGKAYEKIEHDVLDAHYLILGTLEGAFATREKKLQRWYLLLCPEGRLYS